MCEFDVFLDEEKVFEEAVYLKRKNGNILARNILGKEKELSDVEIVEISVPSEKLTLKSKE